MIPLADVSSYCQLRLVQLRNLMGFYCRVLMQFPLIELAFLTLCLCVTDMAHAADVSSYRDLRLVQ